MPTVGVFNRLILLLITFAVVYCFGSSKAYATCDFSPTYINVCYASRTPTTKTYWGTQCYKGNFRIKAAVKNYGTTSSGVGLYMINLDSSGSGGGNLSIPAGGQMNTDEYIAGEYCDTITYYGGCYSDANSANDIIYSLPSEDIPVCPGVTPPPPPPPSSTIDPWFATNGGGILSGKDGEGIYDRIPKDTDYAMPVGFTRTAIQRSGVLATRGTQNVKLTGGMLTLDIFAKNIQHSFGTVSISALLADSAVPNVIDIDVGCSSALNPATQASRLNPDKVYRMSVSCFELALAGVSSSTYDLLSAGLAVVVVKRGNDGNSIIHVDNPVKAFNNRKRILVFTDAKVVIKNTVGTAQASLAGLTGTYSGRAADVQMAFITTYTNGFLAKSVGVASDTALIIEGPIVAQNNVILTRVIDPVVSGSTYAFPGVYVKFNPFYVAELSKKSIPIAGVFKSKIRWIYD